MTERHEAIALLMLIVLCVLLTGLVLTTQGCAGTQVGGGIGIESERVRVEVAGSSDDGLCVRGEARKLPVGGFVCYDESGKLEVCAIFAGMHICIPMGDA